MEPSTTYSKFWLPKDVSTFGHEIDALMVFIHVFMAVLFCGWGVYFIYCLVKFRAGEGKKAQYAEVPGGFSKVIELAVIAIEVVMLVFFSMPVWARVRRDLPKEEDSVRLRIVGQQFQWNFHYPGADGKFGRVAPEFVNSENFLGIDPKDPDGKDDITTNNYLRFPVGKPVVASLTSKDVIHSFKMPVMRFIHDANPGQNVKVWWQADETGKFEVICAQLCGLGHTRMRAQMDILPQAEFDEWLKKEDAKKKQ